MIIVMGRLHFANYFVPLIYNGKLLQSALKAGQTVLIAFSKSSAAVFLFSISTKDWIHFIKSNILLSTQTR